MSKQIDFNKYINIPYVAAGRSINGLDCWGLVRLVYQNELDITLPGHDEANTAVLTRPELSDYLSHHKESWQRVTTPDVGDIVLMYVNGGPHVGVVVGDKQFIHARSGHESVVERYTSYKWTNHIEGFYRYEPKQTGVSVVGCPHPLKTQKILGHAQPGTVLHNVIVQHCIQAGVNNPKLMKNGIAFVNGTKVSFDHWTTTLLNDGDVVEFRVLPGDDERGFLTLVVMVIAAVVTQGVSATYSAGWGAAAGMATTFVGMALVNQIAPIIEPEEPDTAKRQYGLAGGSNTASPYAAFPVVLGTHDFTPPLGAQQYYTTNGSDRFLHLLLVWGYGQLDISNLRIGSTPLSNFEDVDVVTLYGTDAEYLDNGELDASNPEVARFLNIASCDVNQSQPQVELATDFTTRTTNQANVTRLDVVLSFPAGLVVYSKEGKAQSTEVQVVVETRRIGYYDSSNNWVETPSEQFKGNFEQMAGIPKTTLKYDSKCIVGIRDGRELFYKINGAVPTENANGWVDESTWPTLTWNEQPLYMIRGSDVYRTYTYVGYTGFTLTFTPRPSDWFFYGGHPSFSVSSGSSTAGINYYQNADNDAFDRTISINTSDAPGQYEVRVRRIVAAMDHPRVSNKCYWQALTEYAEGTRAIRPPKPMAMSAVRIRATNQINGTLEGITGTVSSIQPIWDGTQWRQPTISDRRNNPASLFYYLLKHPSIAFPVSDSEIDLAQLQHWYEFCDEKGFIYENVITTSRPTRQVLAEIAAAGRASIMMPDGKWSVAIDEPKPNISQHFTPSNSWGFSGTRLLPKLPHALRVNFLNRDKEYQADEMMVYADGYNASNTSIIEAIQLPGVTSVGTAAQPGPGHKLARFHMEQLILRPEEYTLYADLESIICTRGDRVKVNHDVPMWGLGSGRIKEVITNGSGQPVGVSVDEPVQMEAGKKYTIRWRTSANQSNTAEITGLDGLHNDVFFITSVTTAVPSAGDLFLFGLLNQESVDCLVKSVEPLQDFQARLTLTDYAPAVYDAENKPFGTWESQITLAPPLARGAIQQQPVIEGVYADERALTRSAGSSQANIVVSFRTDIAQANGVQQTLSPNVSFVEAQYRLDGATAVNVPWKPVTPVTVSKASLTIGPLTEKLTYDVRIRFVSDLGHAGPWVTADNVYVSGKTNPPSTPTDLTYSFADTSLTSATVTLDWTQAPESDVVDYEVSRPGRTVTVRSNTFTELAEWTGQRTYSVRARDEYNNFSLPAELVISKVAPNPPLNFRAETIDNNVLFRWDNPPITSLPIAYAELYRGDTFETAESIGKKSGGFTTVFETSGGLKSYWLVLGDTENTKSAPAHLTVNVNAPPDYVLRANTNSSFNGTLSNAVYEDGYVVLPINTTETIEQHFTSHGWTSPQDQIIAGYPIFIEPSETVGYYEETIDYEAVLAASRVTVTPTIQAITGTPSSYVTISARASTGDAWTDYNMLSVFLTNFRYLKIRITVGSDGHSLAKLTDINTRLDVKKKTHTVTVNAVAADVNGTVVYMTSDGTPTGDPLFIDVDGIQATANSTTPVTTFYDFTDNPYPTQFKVFAVTSNTGTRVSCPVSCSITGV